MLAPSLAASGLPAAPVVALMAIGVLVALGGHIARSRRTIAIGVAVLFAATLLMIIGAYVSYQDGTTDPRPAQSPTGSF